MGAVGGNRGRRPIEKEEAVESGGRLAEGDGGRGGWWSPVLAHPAREGGVSPVAKIIGMVSGSNTFCLAVLGA
jgi:hypothetical protein